MDVEEEKLCICMVSDFFCPNTGGVETHIYYLSQCLIKRGHKVIVITHAYGDRRGIRWLSNGLKVYYLPFIVFYNGCALPTVFCSLPWIRYVLIRENVHVVHGHSSFSCLAHETLLHAQALNIRAIFTDHSLFGFADLSSILTNQLLRFSLTNVFRVICVSHTSKENTVLRASLNPENVSVIPNAVDCDCFTPDPDQFFGNPITIVVVSRLVYRKGSDFLVTIIPEICRKFPEVSFLIAGDGPKRIGVEEIREKCFLQDRVIMLGMIPHTEVRNVLVQGQIFLNTSLTEAFCMAIVEAASCGLHVVTTKVGGIPEVLPEDMMTMVEPNNRALITALSQTITKCRSQSLPDPVMQHRRVRLMYYWPDIAERVEVVYREIATQKLSLRWDRWNRYFKCGFLFGLFFIFIAATHQLFADILEWIQPAKKITKIPTKRPNSPERNRNFCRKIERK